MKKSILLILSMASSMFASEFDYGVGTFSMKGGFVGLEGSIDADVSTFSLSDRHSNFLKRFFYGYDLTWYKSETMRQAQKRYNSYATHANNFLRDNGLSNFTIPAMKYELEGLDANVRLGYDVIHNSRDNYLGVGIVVGLSTPWIDNMVNIIKNNKSSTDSGLGLYKNSKTKIKTYKIGPSINFQKSINKNISLYGLATYAYQKGDIKNSYAKADYSVDGTFQEYNFGLYFTPFTSEFKWGFLTLSPRIYATVGYKYTKWDTDKMSINLTGQELNSDIMKSLESSFSMDSSIGYFGVGYSF